ncbi:50S ribosomal protein L28 [Buchnera aphidicola]|uniref:Large ribosomal subunit protein bL28 n=1 Tax=Buchnera aphidicola (Stegophylla sp.) TaxID=2315800 RepID=A0A4D6YK89_9GAMM|nr:50S ribosomal protein L28 [Buchnera aphidicola (Stegophylla sp.)]QCI26250.1 50S ribosomal protein L28 [Buchnera aphidicola (Stegophylla sp.)]
MSKQCQITKKKPMFGNNRSHAMNATKKKFSPNLQNHKFWIPSKKKFIKLKISMQGMRMIDKKGIETILKNINKG